MKRWYHNDAECKLTDRHADDGFEVPLVDAHDYEELHAAAAALHTSLYDMLKAAGFEEPSLSEFDLEEEERLAITAAQEALANAQKLL